MYVAGTKITLRMKWGGTMCRKELRCSFISFRRLRSKAMCVILWFSTSLTFFVGGWDLFLFLFPICSVKFLMAEVTVSVVAAVSPVASSMRQEFRRLSWWYSHRRLSSCGFRRSWELLIYEGLRCWLPSSSGMLKKGIRSWRSEVTVFS